MRRTLTWDKFTSYTDFMTAYHLQVLWSCWWCDFPGSRPNVIDDWVLEPRQPEVKTLCPNFVTDAPNPVEHDCTMTTLNCQGKRKEFRTLECLATISFIVFHPSVLNRIAKNSTRQKDLQNNSGPMLSMLLLAFLAGKTNYSYELHASAANSPL